jgi:hypothetical protein
MGFGHDSDHGRNTDHGCDHDCHHCGAAPIQTLAACPFCRTAYPDVEPGVVCPNCAGVSLKGRTVCGACNGSLTRVCVFCAAATLLDQPSCCRCHEPFEGAEERKRASVARGALPKVDPTGAGIFNTLDHILKR